MKININGQTIEATTRCKSTTPSGNGYYVVTYSVDGETVYNHHTGCMAAAPSPIGELDTKKDIWDNGSDKPRKSTVRAEILKILSMIISPDEANR